VGRLGLPIWHGTLLEAYALHDAVEHNCACQSGRRCGAHTATLEQRFLDGIIWARWMREQLLDEEGVTCSSVRWGVTR
jgi:hypothetical protein